MVVVTVGYRLGALGYLRIDAEEDGAGDCGLRDQVAALAWVEAHAAAFGGDPANVTVFGESAGGGSVLHLCALRDRPAFRRAIVQSGEPRTLTTELAVRVRDAFLRELGLDPAAAGVLDRARRRPVDAVLAAQAAVVATLAGPTGLMPFHPTFTADLVDLDPIDACAAGRTRGVDLVIGTCRDELSLWPDPRARDLDDAGLLRLLDRLAGGRGDPDRRHGNAEPSRSPRVARARRLHPPDGLLRRGAAGRRRSGGSRAGGLVRLTARLSGPRSGTRPGSATPRGASRRRSCRTTSATAP
ncbi:MAG: hypothetical protein EBU70_11850 [Actinobacteria bacterium]|nr:hypothetical protein [Actinomycetota bacterium]